MRRILLCLLTGALLLTSCAKEEIILGGDMTMGDITDGVFISDSGLRYNVVSQSCEGDLSLMDRALISCDILKKRSSKEYDIRLLDMTSVLRKEPLTADKADKSLIGEDPIGIGRAWMSGKYINLLISIAFKPESDVKHLVNLVLEDPAASDTLRFRLHHNGLGEVYGGEDDQAVTTGSTYVSFPATQFLSGRKSMPVKISGDWYVHEQDGSISIRPYSVKGTLTD